MHKYRPYARYEMAGKSGARGREWTGSSAVPFWFCSFDAQTLLSPLSGPASSIPFILTVALK
ncbi:MAG: hypothetical protein ACRBBN_10555 [Methyloligellaceae bacterium]